MTTAPRLACRRSQAGDGGIVVGLHRRHDDVVGAGRMGAVEAGEVLRDLDLERRIQRDRAALRRDRLHVGDTGALQHRMRQQEVGGFGAIVQRDDGDDRLAGAARLQRVDELLRLALAQRRVGRRGRQRQTLAAAGDGQHRDTRTDQRPQSLEHLPLLHS